MKSLCRGCGLTFTSVSAFDKHRVGDHATDRRCMTKEEMAFAGMAETPRGWVGAINPMWSKKA